MTGSLTKDHDYEHNSVYLVLLANGTEDYTDIGYPLRFFFLP